MSFNDFITKYDGKPIDYDGFYGYQCRDLVMQYISEFLGFPQPPAGNAINLYTSFNQPNSYDLIANTPTGIPTKGDIMVWGTGVGSNGHTGIYISGNMYSFVSFDQNWPVGSYCHQQNHNYNYVLGWLHPKVVSAPGVDYRALYESTMAKLNQIKQIVS